MNCYRSEERNENSNVVPLSKHWEFAIPHQEIPEGLTSLSASVCGQCHVEIYKEWQQSTHAVAFQDLQFQAEMKKNDIYSCLNCHTPLQNQQEYIVTGLLNGDYKTPAKTINPNFDKALQLESITCATCHVRDGNVIGTTGNPDAPHKTIKDAGFLSETLCMSCHNVSEELNEVLVCSFETGDEWKSNWAKKEGKNCITCHMPVTERPISVGMKDRTSHYHNFPGSGIPKFYDMEVEGLNGLEITADHLANQFHKGDTLKYSLSVKNSFAGHALPTGDPERFYLITYRVTNDESVLLNEKQFRIGEQWQWHPVAKKLSDNNLQPKEARSFDFVYTIPDTKDLTLEVEITKHRMTKENAEWHGILEEYPLSISVWKETYDVN